MSLRLALIGDSIAHGVGASRLEDTLAARLQATLQDSGVAAELRVLAVPGARSTALRAQVLRALTWRPELTVIVIGANDISHDLDLAVASEHLGRAMRDLRAGGSAVVLALAPDLSVVPRVPAEMRPVLHTRSMALRALQRAEARGAGAKVVELGFDATAAFAGDASLFSADRFHPSSAGYGLIAAALVPAVLAEIEQIRASGAGRDDAHSALHDSR